MRGGGGFARRARSFFARLRVIHTCEGLIFLPARFKMPQLF